MAGSVLTITKIQKRRKNSNCLLFLNNSYFMDFSMDIIMKYQLKKGQIIEEELLNEIVREQKVIDVKQAAYNYAVYKPRTKRQVIQKLKTKDFNSQEIDLAIEFLKEFDLIDDKKYAESFAKDYINRKNCGKKKLMNELFKKGIDKDLSTKTVSKIFQDFDSSVLAQKSADKKLKTISHKPEEKKKQLLIAHLQRNGFDWDTIKHTVERILS